MIRAKVAALAGKIDRAYRGSELVLVGVLNGGAPFLADLARMISIPVRLDFIRVRSYGAGSDPGKRIEVTKDVEIDIAGKDVLIVEDIVDTGNSASFLRGHLQAKGPASLCFCALIDKRERREAKLKIDFSGFRLKKGFVVGYGMDYAEDYRQLPQIYILPLPNGPDRNDGGNR
jgi:hypoxanthine phosphoribosyltransferase